MDQRSLSARIARQRHYRRVVLLSFVVSVGIHVLILRLELRRPAQSSPPSERPSLRVAQGLKVVALAPGRADPTESSVLLPRPVERAAEAATLLDESVEEVAPAVDPLATEPPTGITPADALRPRLQDARLWRRLPFSGAARVDLPPSRDGAGGFVPQDQWAFDSWIAEDATGLRWGAAPGAIYLAGIAIPTCGGNFDASNCGFGLPPWQRQEYQDWLRAMAGIEAQKRRGEIAERLQAIRARRDSVRADTRRP